MNQQVNQLSELKLGINARNDKKYEIEAIMNNAVNTKVIKSLLLRLYYLVSWIKYSKNESIWKPTSSVMYF